MLDRVGVREGVRTWLGLRVAVCVKLATALPDADAVALCEDDSDWVAVRVLLRDREGESDCVAVTEADRELESDRLEEADCVGELEPERELVRERESDGDDDRVPVFVATWLTVRDHDRLGVFVEEGVDVSEMDADKLGEIVPDGDAVVEGVCDCDDERDVDCDGVPVRLPDCVMLGDNVVVVDGVSACVTVCELLMLGVKVCELLVDWEDDMLWLNDPDTEAL